MPISLQIKAFVTVAIFHILRFQYQCHPLATLQFNMFDVTTRFLASKSRQKIFALVDTCSDNKYNFFKSEVFKKNQFFLFLSAMLLLRKN